MLCRNTACPYLTQSCLTSIQNRSNSSQRSAQHHLRPLSLLKKRKIPLKVCSTYITVFCVANQFVPARLVEFESGNGVQATRPKAEKKKLIRRPKGKNWKLIDGMRLASNQAKYRRIIVCFLPLISVNLTDLSTLAKAEESEERGWFQGRGSLSRSIKG